jgi:uncharacterized protein YcfJ
METQPRRIHPLVALAAVSVTLASLVAVAAMTGLLPGSHAEAPASAPVATTEPAVAAKEVAAPVTVPASAPKSAPAAHKVAKAAPSPVKMAEAALQPPPPPPPVCQTCGTVESVREIVEQGQGTGLGAVAGGILGGVLGHQVGSGRGNDAATVIGAVGGAVAGHQIEKAQRKAVHYEVTVRLNDGSTHTLTSKETPPWREGDQVKLVDGALYPAG